MATPLSDIIKVLCFTIVMGVLLYFPVEYLIYKPYFDIDWKDGT